MDDIDVEKIMDEVRAQAARERPVWEAVRFEDIPLDTDAAGDEPGGAAAPEELERDVAEAREHWRVAFFRPIQGGRLKGFFKRAVRKLIRFCVEPVTLEVTAFNRSVARCLGSLLRFTSRQREADARRDAELEALRARADALKRRLEALEKERR